MLHALVFIAVSIFGEPKVLSYELDKMFCPAVFDYLGQLSKHHTNMRFFVRSCEEYNGSYYAIYVSSTRKKKRECTYLLEARPYSGLWIVVHDTPLHLISGRKWTWIEVNDQTTCAKVFYNQSME